MAGQVGETLGNILIVEDDRDTREMLSALLAMEGFHAVAAEDGLEALHLLRTVRHRAPEVPCLILLDLMMPRMNGWEFIEHHRRLESQTPIIVVSAYGSPDQLGAQGVIAYMRKPVDIEALLELIARHCQRPVMPRPT